MTYLLKTGLLGVGLYLTTVLGLTIIAEYISVEFSYIVVVALTIILLIYIYKINGFKMIKEVFN